MAYFIPNLSDTVWTLVRDIVAYTILNSFIAGNLDAASFALYLGAITGFAGWFNGDNMGEGFVRANIEMMRCSGWISSYCSFLALWSLYEDGEKADVGNEGSCRDRNHSGGGVTVEFRDVCFRYPEAEKDVIHNLNLKVQAGGNIALVGVNGARKTTLVKLQCGFYRPDSGQILINGRDIQEYPAGSYRELLGSVFQDMMIMAASIAENIACCRKEEIDKERLWQVLRLADIEEKIKSLPKQEETMVTNFLDKDGILFSDGEIQRIILARALYKNAPLLLLDEPTSALDPMVEKAIYEKYHTLSKGKTAVFISHRLASTKFCDRILFFENGEIQEDGTHEELMEKQGRYAEMFSIQSQYYKEDGYGGEE